MQNIEATPLDQQQPTILRVDLVTEALSDLNIKRGIYCCNNNVSPL